MSAEAARAHDPFSDLSLPGGFPRAPAGGDRGETGGFGGISALNFELGRAFGRAAISVARESRITLSRIDLSARTAIHFSIDHHEPPAAAATASTLQLGESAVIAAMTDLPVVADFRPMDIALGGEGAPLAPLAHPGSSPTLGAAV